MKPMFLVTIDAEGDNLWARPREITTRNADYLRRFQDLCEQHGLRPTYLTNYEMATAPAFQRFGRDVLARGTAEIGMHLHAWNSPPIVPLTDDDFHHMPFLTEYAPEVIARKVAAMTDLLQQVFGVKMLSHRGGRWAMNETYAAALVEHGYAVDCSVTPHVSWRATAGAPGGSGGPDYTGFPETSYFVDLSNISRPGDSPLLEVPLTTWGTPYPAPIERARRLVHARAPAVARRFFDRAFPRVWWMYPGRRQHMRAIVTRAVGAGRDYVEFALHSSELMPGGSPAFPDGPSIEALYRRLGSFFGWLEGRAVGATLGEYYRTRVPAAGARPASAQ